LSDGENEDGEDDEHAGVLERCLEGCAEEGDESAGAGTSGSTVAISQRGGDCKPTGDITKWSPLLVCAALALQRRWMMAKTGAPDVHRAGLAVVKDVADGVIPVYFWPPR
jgi:hypothetical protein